LQVNVYEYDAVHGLYDLIQQGSAVVIDTTTAVTNAHVVADEEGDTPYFYEVCKTTNPSANPECFSSAVIKKIRTEKDLAVLKFSAQSDIVPVVFTTEEIAL
jgi:S1-C subfamily serine protease